MLTLKGNMPGSTITTISTSTPAVQYFGTRTTSYKYTSGPALQRVIERYWYLIDSESPRVNGSLKIRPNAFSRKRSKSYDLMVAQSGTKTYTNGSNNPTVGREVYSSPVGYQFVEGAWFDQQKAIATNRAYSNFLSEIRNANAMLPIIYHERVKTHNMVAGRLIMIKEGLLAAKSDAIKLIKELSGTRVYRGRPISNLSAYWLEFWFGWYPSIMDLWTFATHENKPVTRVVHGRATQHVTKTDLEHPQKREFSARIQAHCRAEVTLVDPQIKSLQEFGLLNPALVLWEATKLSWLIDYFTKFSDYLAQFDAFAGVIVKDYSMTVDAQCSVVINYFDLSPPPTVNLGGYPFDNAGARTLVPGEIRYRHKYRDLKLVSLPAIQLTRDLSIKQFANALALLTSKLRR